MKEQTIIFEDCKETGVEDYKYGSTDGPRQKANTKHRSASIEEH
jgi:hypothetical protein